MLDQQQFNPFVRAIQLYLKREYPHIEVKLSKVREVLARAMSGLPSDRFVGILEHTPLPVNSVPFQSIAPAIKSAFSVELPAEFWRWPLPDSFRLEPSERAYIWQLAFKDALNKHDIDGMWRDSFFDLEPFIKPIGDGRWGVCHRSPVPFAVCRDVFGPEWVTKRHADNSIADNVAGRKSEDRLFHLGLAAIWKKDYLTAFDRFEEALRLGHPMATFNLAWMLSEGLGRDQDFPRASSLYQNAANLGVKLSHHNLGRMYLKGTNDFPQSIPDAIRHFELAVKAGVAASFGCLGLIYSRGNGVPADRERAIDLLMRAFELGDIQSMNELAVIMDADNDGVSTPHTFEMYRLAAKSARELDFPNPIFHLATCFLHGNGVEKNLVKARRLFRIAAKSGESSAAMNLGLMYLNGEGTAADPHEARRWFELAAADEHADAINALGSIEFRGLCGLPNHRLAWFLFSEAAELGCPLGLANQARCLASGLGTEQDMQLAYELLEQAEALGLSTAREMRIQWEAQA